MWNISHLQLHQQYAVDIGLVGKTNEAFESHVLVYLDYPMVLFGSQGEHFWPMFIGDQIDLRPDPLTNLPSCTHPGQRPFLTLNGANCTDPSDASLSSMISMPIKTLTALVIDQKYN